MKKEGEGSGGHLDSWEGRGTHLAATAKGRGGKKGQTINRSRGKERKEKMRGMK